MKKQTFFIVLVSLSFFTACEKSIIEETETSEALVATQALGSNRTKSSILSYFNQVVQDNKVIVGQHCGDGADQTASFYDTFVEGLFDETGKYPAIVGADFGFNPSETYPVQTLIDHWNAGGLVTVSWHADNPFRAGYDVRWNSVQRKKRIKLRALRKNARDNKAKTSYRNELDDVARALQKLKDAGVVVIWRPFHEMNADWFWWGINDYNNAQTNEKNYIALWHDMYDTLTNDYGLTNLIWVYAPTEDFGWNADVSAYYPGDDYVDLVGVDYYGEAPDYPDFNAISSLGKTVVMAEAGPVSSSYGNWDEVELVNRLKGRAAYFLQWHSWPGADVAIKDNRRVSDMMNSADAITRDEL